MKLFLTAFLLTASLAPALEVSFEWDHAYPRPLEYRLFVSTPEEERLLSTVTGDITQASGNFGPGKHTVFVRAVYAQGQSQSEVLVTEIVVRELWASDVLDNWRKVASFEELLTDRRFYKVETNTFHSP